MTSKKSKLGRTEFYVGLLIVWGMFLVAVGTWGGETGYKVATGAGSITGVLLFCVYLLFMSGVF